MHISKEILYIPITKISISFYVLLHYLIKNDRSTALKITTKHSLLPSQLICFM